MQSTTRPTTTEASGATPSESGRARFQHLTSKYGYLRGLRYFLGGEPARQLEEDEPRLPLDTTLLIFVTSAAAAIVSGSVEIIAIVRAISAAQRDWTQLVVSSVMIGALVLMVFSMDRSLARTIPRIRLFFMRGEWAMGLESVCYAAAVGAIEITTLTILILNEQHIGDILKGRPLIAQASWLYVGIAVARGTMTFWTIIHSHLIHERLPIQIQTATRKLAAHVGGGLMDLIEEFGKRRYVVGDPGELMAALVALLTPPRRVPFSYLWNPPRDKEGHRINRRDLQETYNEAHYKLVSGVVRRLLGMAQPAPAAPGAPAGIPALPAEPTPEDALLETAETVAEAGKSPASAGEHHHAPPPVEPAPIGLKPLKAPSAYVANDPAFAKYVLPAGIELETRQPLTRMADALGVPRSTLSTAWSQWHMEYETPRAGQNAAAKYVAVYQVLALVECGALSLPEHVQVAQEVA